MGYLLKSARGGLRGVIRTSDGGGAQVGQPYTPSYSSAPNLAISTDPQADVAAYISDLIMQQKAQYTTADGKYGYGYTDEDVMEQVMPKIRDLVASGKFPAHMVNKALASEALIDSDVLSNPKYQIQGAQTGGAAGKKGMPGAPKVSGSTGGRQPMTSPTPTDTMHYSPKKKLAEQSGSYVDTTTGKRVGTQERFAPSTIVHPAGVKPQKGTGTYVRDPETGELYTTRDYKAIQAQRQSREVKSNPSGVPANPNEKVVAPSTPVAPNTTPATTPATPATPTATVESPAPTTTTTTTPANPTGKVDPPAPGTVTPNPASAPTATTTPANPTEKVDPPAPVAPNADPVAAPGQGANAQPGAPKKVSRREQYEADGWTMDTSNTYGKNWMYKDTVGADGKTMRTYVSPRMRRAGRGGIQVEAPSTPQTNPRGQRTIAANPRGQQPAAGRR